MKKHIKYLLLGIGIALFIGFPFICVKLFAGVSGGGSGTSTPEGTAVLSTGETGGTKFLREDGDNTSSWQTPSAGDLKADGTVPLTANWDVGNFSITGRDLVADYGVAAATGAFSGAVTSLTLDTGLGANELYDMDQHVLTTSAVTFKDLTLTYGLNAATMTLTGSGQSSLNAGLIVNEDGGANATTDAFRVETNTEAYMINTSADADTMTLGGITNGIQIAKGGKVTSLGTAIGLAWSGSPKDFAFTICSPSNTYIVSGSSIPIGAEQRFAITIDSISVTCDADPTTEISGDLKYADAAIGWANATIINSITTTAGVLKDASMTSGNVAANKQLYINLHAQPDAATKFLAITLYGHYQ